MALGPFTVHGTRTWRIGRDVVRVDAVAREGAPGEGGDPHEGTIALIVIRRGNWPTPEQVWMRVGESVELGGEQWTLSRAGDRGRVAEWAAHEPTVPGRQPGRFAIFAPAPVDS
jgi:hypothetical protein